MGLCALWSPRWREADGDADRGQAALSHQRGNDARGKPRAGRPQRGPDPVQGQEGFPEVTDTTASCEGCESSVHLAEGVPSRLGKYLQNRAPCQLFCEALNMH